MGEQIKPMKFEDQDFSRINEYADLAERYIPGRLAIFAIVESAFHELLTTEPAKILVLGAGGGEDILRLGTENPSWSFVGVDTFEPMVEMAKVRLAASPVGERSVVHTTAIDQLDDTGFDAATCILTAHFVPDDGSKLAFFEAIRGRMKPGAPLAIIDGVGVAGERDTELLRRIWVRHAMRNGIPEAEAAKNAKNFSNIPVVSAEREEELLQAAGFKDLVPIFQGLAIRGWLAFA